MNKLPRVFFNEYFRRKPMRLSERENESLFMMERTSECDLEYMPVSECEADKAALRAEVERLRKRLSDSGECPECGEETEFCDCEPLAAFPSPEVKIDG